MNMTPRSIVLGAGLAAVVAAVLAGLFALGSPMEERARRIDERRVNDLQGIMAATNLFWTRHARLPVSLEELTSEPGVTVGTRDPASAAPYPYQPLDSLRYEVCATFDRESEELSRDPKRDLWVHRVGQQCFQLEAEEIDDAKG